MAQAILFLFLKIGKPKSQTMNANQHVIHACCLKRLDFSLLTCTLSGFSRNAGIALSVTNIKASLCLPLQEIFLFLSVSSSHL